MPIETLKISDAQADRILAYNEGHFCDLKSVDIRPARLTVSVAALANADGGELFIGIDSASDFSGGFFIGLLRDTGSVHQSGRRGPS